MSESGARPRLEVPLARRILAEQIPLIVVQTPQGVVGPAALAAIGAVVLWNEVDRIPLLLTLGLCGQNTARRCRQRS